MKGKIASIIFLLAVPVLAIGDSFGGKGQGGIVIKDNAKVYQKSKGATVKTELNLGNAVAGTTLSLFQSGTSWMYDEKNGRVRVTFFVSGNKGKMIGGWMNPNDLSKFTFDGSCGDNSSPLAVKGFSRRWNPCFQEARDQKIQQLKEEEIL